jgi:hypothetical protein
MTRREVSWVHSLHGAVIFYTARVRGRLLIKYSTFLEKIPANFK